MKKNLLFLFAFIFMTTCLYAQEEKALWQDGQIWFKVKAEYPVMKTTSIDGNQAENPLDLPLKTLGFLEELSTQFEFKQLSRPFYAAKGCEKLQNTYLLEFYDIQNVEKIISLLEAEEAVEYAEKVPMCYTTYNPNDTYYSTSYMWGLFKINAAAAWDYSFGSSSITVAVVDNAVDRTHTDLTASIWTNPGEIPGNGIDDDGNGYIDDINGWDAGDNDNNPNPPNSTFDHGTHVAGTVGATTDNNTGVASIGFGVSIIAVKATKNSAGSNSVTNGYDGIIYAANAGADVINLSWGGSSYSSTGQNVINYAYNQGSIIVAAAGNDNVSTQFYPAAFNNVVCVASTNSSDQKSSFSNYGSYIDVSAPGTNIASTVPGNNYSYMSGTSMASPLVAGLCGLMLSYNPGLSQTDLVNCLTSSCTDISSQNPSYTGQLGAGRIDAAAAMACVSGTLTNAPLADFSANITTVYTGGSVDFTDLSMYNPTSWTWTFSGGSPSTYNGQNPPAITYNTPGTYNVSLTVTNTYGNDTETKSGYINVVPPSGCDTISNIVDGDPLYYRPFGSGNGYLPGHNGYQITRWADKFTNSYPSGTYLQYVDYFFVIGETNNPSSYITATIWDATGSGGSPGSILASQNVPIQVIEDNITGTGIYPTRVNFGSPIALPAGDFFIGFSLTHAAGDSVCLGTNQDLSTVTGRSNTLWAYNTLGSGIWEDFTTYTTSEMNTWVFAYATTYPITASASPASSTICEGDYINFSSAGSTNQTSAKWYFNGSTTDTTSTLNPTVLFDTPGTHTQYLVSYNTCGFYDIDSASVIVNARPNLTISSAQDTICHGNSTQLNASGATNYSWTPTASLSNPNIANPIATPTATTTYTVEGDNGTCTNDVSITVYVDNPPTADFTYPSALCDGIDIQFDGSISNDASTYFWTFQNGSSPNSTHIFPSINFPPGTHDVKLVVENTCAEKDSITYTIQVDTVPIVDLGSDFNVCINVPVTLDAGTGFSSYTWSGGTSSTHQLTVSSPTAGQQTYGVTVTDGNACPGTDDITITYETCTGIMTNEDMGISIYPNPTTNSFYVQIKDGMDENLSLIMYNQLGQVVKTQELEVNSGNNIFSIAVNDLSKAMYFIEIRSKENSYIEKIQIQ
jgi:serine protease